MDSIRLVLDWLDASLLNNKACSNWSQGYKSNSKLNMIQLVLYRLGLDQILLDNRLGWIKIYYQIAFLISIKILSLDQWGFNLTNSKFNWGLIRFIIGLGPN